MADLLLISFLKEFFSSEACRTNTPTADSVCASPPFQQDCTTLVPDPINLFSWIESRRDLLDQGQVSLDLFGAEHPDKEFTIKVYGNGTFQTAALPIEVYLHQIFGEAVVEFVDGNEIRLGPGDCTVIPPNISFTSKRAKGSVGLLVAQDPYGNKSK
jgi:hypothetical protein